uniref:Uncharacterized protein n=1 Tax=Oryza sativa subsp. japonica TaxID=39947 RepID=Q6ZBR0_ORYSJ|nr:hypothetical protein [Oryza sativa Japonica Group]BAD09656.1 hypothetical protein [Oryza sativa Japonica Group]
MARCHTNWIHAYEGEATEPSVTRRGPAELAAQVWMPDSRTSSSNLAKTRILKQHGVP